ncbi:MAG: hypothetical protein KDB66_10880, partial [Solirubrobacterales bacterium]|nr:hypothetical protein [Solirubrobacterales bacterium]
MITSSEIIEREKRWSLIAGIASVAGVAIILATFGQSSAAVRVVGLADRLREIDADQSSLILSSIGQFIGWSLLAIPLVFLFRAAAARAPQVRSALIWAMVVAPMLIGVGSLVSAGSVLQAASDFKTPDQAAINKCVNDKVADESGTTGESGATGDKGTTGDTAKTGTTGDTGTTDAGGTGTAATSTVTPEQRSDFVEDCADDAAQDVRSEVSLAPLEKGLGLAGLLGFTVSVIYVALWAMRTGLLSRFWGSLGIALGVVFAFFTLFTLIWFIYIGLLLAGWVPGGRPPAWRTGEAMPWPK